MHQKHCAPKHEAPDIVAAVPDNAKRRRHNKKHKHDKRDRHTPTGHSTSDVSNTACITSPIIEDAVNQQKQMVEPEGNPR
jgi:hypothetical protein